MMTNNEIHQAFNCLYQTARLASVNANTGDMRERCAKIVSDAIIEKYPLNEDKEPQHGTDSE